MDISAQMPREGGVIQRVVSLNYYYVNCIDCIDGSGIGFRDAKELKRNLND